MGFGDLRSRVWGFRLKGLGFRVSWAASGLVCLVRFCCFGF